LEIFQITVAVLSGRDDLRKKPQHHFAAVHHTKSRTRWRMTAA